MDNLTEDVPRQLEQPARQPAAARLTQEDPMHPLILQQLVTDRVMNELMGKDASARFRFIMERADEAEELDV